MNATLRTPDLDDALPADDDLDAAINAPKRETPSAIELVPTFEEPCRKCRGRARFISYSGRDCGACFTCKGTGKQVFKTNPEQRFAKRAQVAAKKQTAAQT